MMNYHTNQSVSISELKKNPTAIIKQAQGQAITILSHNKPTAYLVSVAEYESLIGQKGGMGSRLAKRFAPFADDEFEPPSRDDVARGCDVLAWH